MSQWPMERMYPLHFQYNAANKELQPTVVVVGAAVALLSVKWTAAKNDGGNSRQLFLGDHNSDKLSPSPTAHLTTTSDCRPSLHDDENLKQFITICCCHNQHWHSPYYSRDTESVTTTRSSSTVPKLVQLSLSLLCCLM